ALVRMHAVEISKHTCSKKHRRQQRSHRDQRRRSVARLRFLESGHTVGDGLDSRQCRAAVRKSSEQEEQCQRLGMVAFRSFYFVWAGDWSRASLRVVVNEAEPYHEKKDRK